MPIDLAVPATVRMADSRDSVLRSPSFFLAISSTSSLVMDPADSRPGFWDPDWTPMAFLIRAETGGSLVIKVKDRSS